jgi:hypothetical protein
VLLLHKQEYTLQSLAETVIHMSMNTALIGSGRVDDPKQSKELVSKGAESMQRFPVEDSAEKGAEVYGKI